VESEADDIEFQLDTVSDAIAPAEVSGAVTDGTEEARELSSVPVLVASEAAEVVEDVPASVNVSVGSPWSNDETEAVADRDPLESWVAIVSQLEAVLTELIHSVSVAVASSETVEVKFSLFVGMTAEG